MIQGSVTFALMVQELSEVYGEGSTFLKAWYNAVEAGMSQGVWTRYDSSLQRSVPVTD